MGYMVRRPLRIGAVRVGLVLGLSWALSAAAQTNSEVTSNSTGAAGAVSLTNVIPPGTPAPTNPVSPQLPPVHPSTTNPPPAPKVETTAAKPDQLLESAAWLRSFKIKAGFRIEFAVPPNLVVGPAALAFDERGRLFVAEMRDRPDSSSPVSGRVRVLEDPGGEGVYTTATVYADDVRLPSALACYGGGVFVASTPNILYFKDSAKNGIADIRRVMFTGFGNSNVVSPDLVINSFKWGPDNRIHGAGAGLSGMIRIVEGDRGLAMPLAGSDFSFDPRSLAFFAETGSAQSGLAFDTWGRKFLTDYQRPLYRPMYQYNQAIRNPFFVRAPALVDVVRPATPLYLGTTNNLPEGSTNWSLRPSTNTTWLARACGTVIYRSGLFPTNYFQNAFIADPQAHVIYRAILRDTGTQTVSERDEPGAEFLSSSDPLFRPSQIIEGPEGALYIADFRDGINGCVYRVIPDAFTNAAPIRLGDLPSAELLPKLASTNAWERETTVRLLSERLARETVPLLSSMLANSRLAYARISALHTLNALGALTDGHLAAAMRDIDGRVREQAVLLSTRNAVNGVVSPPIWAQLELLAGDGYFPVRYQLALLLGDIRHENRPALLSSLLRRDFANPWMQTAVLSSSWDSAGALFYILAEDQAFRSDPAGAAFLQSLAGMIGIRGQPDDLARIFEYVLRNRQDFTGVYTVLSALGDGLQRGRSSLSQADVQKILPKIFEMAYLVSLDHGAAEPVRAGGIRLLGFSSYSFSQVSQLLMGLIGPAEPVPIQSAALASLGEFPGTGPEFLERWPVLVPALRPQAAQALCSRLDRLSSVVTGLERGILRPIDLTPAQINLLRSWPTPGIREPALRLLGPIILQRPAVMQAYAPAVRLNGVAARGRDLFIARCAACHQIGGVGAKFGPDLAGVKLNGRQYILESILQPSARIRPGFETSVAQTLRGDTLLGIATEQEAQALVMNLPGGYKTVWPMASIQLLQKQTWSMMPDGVEAGVSVQAMADLLDFLMTAP